MVVGDGGERGGELLVAERSNLGVARRADALGHRQDVGGGRADKGVVDDDKALRARGRGISRGECCGLARGG